MVDILIRGGQVVTPAGVGNWDIGIQGEKIVMVSEPGAVDQEATKVIDASGKIVVPGGIEPHAHIGDTRLPDRAGADPVSKTALHGGTTTVLDFATQMPGHDLHHALSEAGLVPHETGCLYKKAYLWRQYSLRAKEEGVRGFRSGW
jgi:dihydropyrimidinase